jgi:hypothetical protein
MNAMNTQQARVIDPILTGIAQGYTHAPHAGRILFPAIPVLARGGKVIEFGKEGFRDYQSRRAPGADTQQIQFGYEGKDFVLDQYALNASVPREHMQDAQQVPNIDMGKRATNTVLQSLSLTAEIEQAKLATNPDSYADDNKLALTGTDLWSDPDSDPIRDIENAKDQVATTCGVEPNRMVIGRPVMKSFKAHPKIIERFKYTSAESITTAMLASLFDLDELAVGKSNYVDGPADDAPFKPVWGDVACLGYVPAEMGAIEQPSFGYTYVMTGHPFVEKPFWDNSKKSWVYGVTYERKPVLTGISSGFLFLNATGG